MKCSCFVRKPQDDSDTVPFSSAEEVWFWFIRAHEAKASGARVKAGMALYPRPCEPVDVARIVDRLYRQRRLVRDHLLVLAHYGRRLMAPNPDYRQEIKASSLWREAFERIEPALRSKGIVA